MRKYITTWTAMILVITLLAGCSGNAPSSDAPDASGTETTTVPTTPEAAETSPETTAPAAEEINLEERYNQGVEALSKMGDSAPILFPETNVDYLENFYPGLAAVEMKQLYAGIAPVTNAPFEIIMVEVANPDDVQTVIDIFQARVDREAGDTTYPENTKAWINNTKITSRGNYVFLAVLMDPCEIPAEFILD